MSASIPCYDYDQGQLINIGFQFSADIVLPRSSILLQRTPFTGWQRDWVMFWSACEQLAKQITQPDFVFVDACWDPVTLTNEVISHHLDKLREIFARSKICVLSARAQHFYDNLHGCVYFPLFLMYNYPDLVEQPRSGRIGCLNRRNAVHRVLLMLTLLDKQLLDRKHDIYSVMFTGIFDDHWIDLDAALKTSGLNAKLRQWPARIATYPDNFPNDYSINHPAWHTGISIITETEPGDYTLICEKTAKGILSKSCFSIYMSGVGYRLLEDLGFQPRFFDSHAEGLDFSPIVKICQEIDTADAALAYRNQRINQINHNFDWFAFRQGIFQSRPWWRLYQPKLAQALEIL